MYINAVALKNFHLNLMVFMQINVLFICLVIFVVVDYVFIVKNPENINKHWNGMRKGGNLFVLLFGYSRILPNYGYFNCCSGDFRYVLIREFFMKTKVKLEKQIFILNFKIFSK